MNLPPHWKSSISLEKSLSELRDVLIDHGAAGMNYKESYKTGDASIEFNYRGKVIRFDVSGKHVAKAFLETHPWSTRTKKSERTYHRWINENAHRVAVRIMFDQVSIGLDAADHGVGRFEDIFLSHFVTAEGDTIGERVARLMEDGHLEMETANDKAKK